LLDLPMVRHSHADWFRATMALCRRGIRAELAHDWLSSLAWRRHDMPADANRVGAIEFRCDGASMRQKSCWRITNLGNVGLNVA
jgi:predicted YcjX-like family ATPase